MHKFSIVLQPWISRLQICYCNSSWLVVQTEYCVGFYIFRWSIGRAFENVFLSWRFCVFSCVVIRSVFVLRHRSHPTSVYLSFVREAGRRIKNFSIVVFTHALARAAWLSNHCMMPLHGPIRQRQIRERISGSHKRQEIQKGKEQKHVEPKAWISRQFGKSIGSSVRINVVQNGVGD